MRAVRVAVVSAYHGESLDMIRRCHESVINQETQAEVTHFLVADGNPRAEIDEWNAVHFKIPKHADYGDTPRMIGCASAATLGYDAIAMLDADNWYYPHHIETMLSVHYHTNAPVVTTTRTLVRLDGSIMRTCPESNGNTFCDTNCYLLMKEAFPAFKAWGFKDKRLSVVGDRFFWNEVKNNYTRAHCTMPTVYYTTNAASYYLDGGETPPDGVKIIVRVDGGDKETITYGEYVRLKAEGRTVTQVDQIHELRQAGLF